MFCQSPVAGLHFTRPTLPPATSARARTHRGRSLGGRPHRRQPVHGDGDTCRTGHPVHDPRAAPGSTNNARTQRSGRSGLQRRAGSRPRSLAWDQGKEIAGHAELAESTGMTVYLCDPHSPCQRPSNENTNGLVRQWFPRSTNFYDLDPERVRIAAIAQQPTSPRAQLAIAGRGGHRCTRSVIMSYLLRRSG